MAARYIVDGARKDTGAEQQLVIEADDPKQAEQIAAIRGFFVTNVRVASPPETVSPSAQDPHQRRAPPATARRRGRLVYLVPLVILVMIGGVALAMVVAVMIAATPHRATRSPDAGDAEIRQLPLFADYPGAPTGLPEDANTLANGLAIRQMQMDLLRYLKSKVGSQFSEIVDFYDAQVDASDSSMLDITLFAKNGTLVAVQSDDTPDNTKFWSALKRGIPVRVHGSVQSVASYTVLGNISTSLGSDYLAPAEEVRAILGKRIRSSMSVTIHLEPDNANASTVQNAK